MSRPNRFLAHVEVDSEIVIAHVKNTGRCRELLIPGATVFLTRHNDPKRKTQYSLVKVMKGDMMVNMDSQAPNALMEEYIRGGGLLESWDELKREKKYGNSRIDLYARSGEQEYLIEVKGVTLENDGLARFPDAPTERGIKHIHELTEASQKGIKAYIVFVIQMEPIHSFTPNDDTQPEFRQALLQAAANNVIIKAFNCRVTEDSLDVLHEIPVLL